MVEFADISSIIVTLLLVKSSRRLMAPSWHQSRFYELQAMRQNDPRQLIALFSAISGRPVVNNQLPHKTSFSAMIDAILDHDTRIRETAGNTGDQSA
jgi:hypothetical protein